MSDAPAAPMLSLKDARRVIDNVNAKPPDIATLHRWHR